jgi:hypothetical protein
MAKKKSSAVQLLTISLIIFVMLTFVLAVTSYVFYAQVADATAAEKAAQEAAAEVRQKLTAAEGVNKELIETSIGAEPGSTVDLIDEELTAWRDRAKQFEGAGNTTPSYRSLVQTYENALQKANKDNDSLVEENKGLKENLKKAQSDHSEARDTHQAQLKKVQDDLAETQKKRQKSQEDFDKEVATIQQKLDAASTKAKRLEGLEKKIHDEVAPYVSFARRDDFSAANNAADQVAILIEELKDRDAAIQRQNQVLGAMRVADTRLQGAILAATPADDRIDGFDGHIVVVNERERSVLIRYPRTIGIRPGMLFFVYAPGDQLPLISAKKGIVEIVAVESGTIARGRVLDTSTYDPIITGDAVATSLWSPLMPLEVVIVGHIQIDRDSETDNDDVEELIRSVGGTVTDTVTHSSSILVDAGEPRQTGGDEVAGWTDADKQRRIRNLSLANRLGVKVVRIDGFLELFGLEENYFDADHLVTPTP